MIIILKTDGSKNLNDEILIGNIIKIIRSNLQNNVKHPDFSRERDEYFIIL